MTPTQIRLDLVSLPEADSTMYMGASGAWFSTPDGSVTCEVTGAAASCIVAGSTVTWPEDLRADAGSPQPADVVGWDGGAFDVPVRTWSSATSSPATGRAVPLEAGTRLSLAVSFEQDAPKLMCGATDASTMVCDLGNRGFAVLTGSFLSW
ncbi:hypothetical protein [Corynebacterium sp. 335C]